MNKIRKDLKSIWWQPKLVENAIFDNMDIPFCPTTASSIPKEILTYEEAKNIYHKKIKIDKEFKEDSFVCFYMDDYKFDTFKGIWFNPKKALNILKHFKGIITPDFSTYADFPLPLKIWNTYRMRAFGLYCSFNGLQVINNVRGRFKEDFSYCFNGIETNSIVAIGTLGSGLKLLENRPDFEYWLDELIKRLKPKIILVYGSSKYPCFNKLKEQEIQIIEYEASTSKYFKRRYENE